MKPLADACRACRRDLKKVAPRAIIQIDGTTKLPPGVKRWRVIGSYCSKDCALNAILPPEPK